MFDFFKHRTAEDYKKIAEDTYKLPEPSTKPVVKEHYRVGRTDDGYTTLTMIDSSGYGSMTLTMNQDACEQMIRMLEATFIENIKAENV